MYAVITLLDNHSLEKTEEIQSLIYDFCPAPKKGMTLAPHISWQGAEEYVLEEAHSELARLASRYEPFFVRSGGLGLFTGKEPILYLNLSRSPRLAALHQDLWVSLKPSAKIPNHKFSPETWIPHISLYYADEITSKKLAYGLEKMMGKNFEFEISINTISMASNTDGFNDIESTYPLGN